MSKIKDAIKYIDNLDDASLIETANDEELADLYIYTENLLLTIEEEKTNREEDEEPEVD